MSHCPSCGRYVGPPGACPYCGARMTGRMPIRIVKITAILLATVGLGILWFVATHAEVPTVAIGQVRATMNLAYVRVEGRCTRSPSYNPETGYLSFWIADETGELHVASYREESQALIEAGRVPALGDRVAVVGTLRIREDFRSLTINVPGEVSIARAEPDPCPIGEIDVDQTHRRVRVRGQVRQVIEPYPGLMLIALRDETGALDVALSDDTVTLSGVTPAVTIGQSIEVVAAVSQYEGRPQLVPAAVTDITPLDDHVPIAANRFVMELSREDVGAWIGVHGTVASVDRFSKGIKLTLDDGTGAVTVLLWQDVAEELESRLSDDGDLTVGAEVEVKGELSEYRGEMEVIPELAADVRVVATASPRHVTLESTGPAVAALTSSPVALSTPTLPPPPPPTITATTEVSVTVSPTPAVDLTPIWAVKPDHVGEQVTLEGTVVEAVSFSKGFRLTLEDDGAQIVLLLWHEVYDDCWDRAKINPGAVVRASGEISQYEGQLQIEPCCGSDVKAIHPQIAQAPQREIGSISVADEGQRVMILGEVIRAEGRPGAVKVFVGDDGPAAQAEIMVFVWRNVLERIIDQVGLGTPGSRVRVVGRVQVYRGNLEIVPALPSDVTVLEMP